MSWVSTSYARSIPTSLEPKFVAELASLGYDCEIHPDFKFSDGGDSLWLKVNRFPAAKPRRHGDIPLLVGVGYEFSSPIEHERMIKLGDVPLEVMGYSYSFSFRSSGKSTSNLDFAFHVLGIAAITVLTDGLSEDDGCFTSGTAAIKSALDLIRRRGLASEVGSIPFTDWPPLDPEKERNFKYEGPIRDLDPPKRAWWKLWNG